MFYVGYEAKKEQFSHRRYKYGQNRLNESSSFKRFVSCDSLQNNYLPRRVFCDPVTVN